MAAKKPAPVKTKRERSRKAAKPKPETKAAKPRKSRAKPQERPAPIVDLSTAREIVAQLEKQLEGAKRSNPSFELQYCAQRAEELRKQLRELGATPVA